MRVRLGRTGTAFRRAAPERGGRGHRAGRAGDPAVGRAPDPAAGRLPAPVAGRAFDLLDVPAGPGHRVLLRLERLGAPLGPVLAAPGGRLQFFVQAGSTATVPADLVALAAGADALDLRAIDAAGTAELVLPPADSPRWVRGPGPDRAGGCPPAHLLLGSLAYACRRPGAGRPARAGHRKAA